MTIPVATKPSELGFVGFDGSRLGAFVSERLSVGEGIRRYGSSRERGSLSVAGGTEIFVQ